VRTAVHTALADPAGWSRAPDTRAECVDTLLRAAAQDLLDGPVGRLVQAHGGTIELVDVHDGVVAVRLRGACDGCPAAWMTLHVRLESQLRKRYSGLREVRQVRVPRVPVEPSRPFARVRFLGGNKPDRTSGPACNDIRPLPPRAVERPRPGRSW
jgi:Fe-S cluster biogenesis protein NfuA